MVSMVVGEKDVDAWWQYSKARGVNVGDAPGAEGRRFEHKVFAAYRERDVGVYPVTPCYADPPGHAELLLGYASLAEEDIRSGIRRLAEALDSIAK